MPERVDQGRCLALLCFLPDTGHITQLLQVARLIVQRSGARAVCLLPKRFAALVESFGFEFFPLPGLESGRAAEIFGVLCKRSIFRNAFSDDEDLRDGYWAPLHAAASREMAGVAGELLRLRPTVILADNHVFAEHYRRIAAACGARLVLNRGTGSLVSRRRSFVRAYGLTDLPNAFQRAVELAGFIHRRLRGRWRRLRYAERVGATAACEALLERSITAAFAAREQSPPGLPTITTSSGLCALEPELFPGTVAQPNEVLLAPMSAEPGTLPASMQQWLTSQSRGRIVYVAFGTMVRPSRRMLRSLLRGLRATGASVLWALPAAQRECLELSDLPDHIRFEDYLPQAALLQSGLIGCFVTHAGNSSVQEALDGGVPMLCLPFLWDQPYAASLVAHMGVGIRASRKWLSADQVTRQVLSLLENPGYAQRAREVGARLRALRAAPSQTDWIDALFPERR